MHLRGIDAPRRLSRKMRISVIELVALGRLPDDRDAGIPQLQAFESALKAIGPQVTDREAIALLSVFPASEASCFGLAWSVLHLIESAPGWPCKDAQLHEANPWVKLMLERASRT